MQKKFDFLYESKPNIGWAHGLIACFSALICAYLTMMIFANLMVGDYAFKIIPAMVLTPILMSIYGLYFLFAAKPITVLKRVVFLVTLLGIIFFVVLKVI